MSRKQLAIVINQIIDTDPTIEADIEPVIVEEYKKLSDKQDEVMSKFRKRKKRNKTQKSGE
jgi:hypothetical protein